MCCIRFDSLKDQNIKHNCLWVLNFNLGQFFGGSAYKFWTEGKLWGRPPISNWRLIHVKVIAFALCISRQSLAWTFWPYKTSPLYQVFFFFFDRQKSKRYIKEPKKATPSTQEIYMCAPNKKEKNENPPLIGNLTLISVICLVLMDLKPIILMPLKP